MSIGISKKCCYALRAVFELAFRATSEPITVQEIASVQGIPARFLEIILNELRQAGVVASHRGNAGGYVLAGPPRRITAAQVIEAIEGPISVGAGADRRATGKYFPGDSALASLWTKVNKSVAGVCQDTTFEDLVEWERRSNPAPVPDYSI